MDIRRETKKAAGVAGGAPGATSTTVGNSKRNISSLEVEVEAGTVNDSGTQRAGEGLLLKRTKGVKKAKAAQIFSKVREEAMRASAAATSEMADATRKKAQILADHHAMEVMTMPDELIQTEEAREYMRLRRQEELAKVRERMAPKPKPNAAIHMSRSPVIEREPTVESRGEEPRGEEPGGDGEEEETTGEALEDGHEIEEGGFDLNKGYTFEEPLEVE
ncbi:hypothetical protein M758_UG250800 [Ceratodon purpureus]|nr:hypothetical protein M758_UG250800 [Ceratodon purpureus]